MIPGVAISGQSADMTNRPKLDLLLRSIMGRTAESNCEKCS